MECRWKEIKPNQEKKKIVCLLVSAQSSTEQAYLYKKIFTEIECVFGIYKERNPVSNKALKLELSIANIKQELNVKYGKYKAIAVVVNWLVTVFSNYCFKTFKNRIAYFKSIPLLSDTVMIDGVLNTVFSGTQDKIDHFVAFLDDLETKGKIKYGIHVTHSSIMSCYVQNRKDNYIHFVNGTEGGYTQAAMMYKAKTK